MKEPRRLLDDPEQPLELRRDLQRTAASAASYDTARGLAALQVALGHPAPLGESAANATDALAASGSAASASGGLSVALKWALAAAISGGAIGTTTWLRTRSEPAPKPAVSAPATPAPRAAPADTPAEMGSPALAPAPAAVTGLEQREPEQPAVRTSGPSPSRREIAQLVRIRALLSRDPAAAHRAIAAAQREFPSGVLREEREGLDAIALFRSGQERRARASAERFIERYPQSPLRPRIERLLAGEDP